MITSVFEMPNTKPPTTNFDEFEKKINIAKKMYCNHAFFFGATAENCETLEKLKNLTPLQNLRKNLRVQ